MIQKEALSYTEAIFRELGCQIRNIKSGGLLITIENTKEYYVPFFIPNYVKVGKDSTLNGIIGLISPDIKNLDKIKNIQSYIYIGCHTLNFYELLFGPNFGDNLSDDKIWCSIILNVLYELPTEKSKINELAIEGKLFKGVSFVDMRSPYGEVPENWQLPPTVEPYDMSGPGFKITPTKVAR